MVLWVALAAKAWGFEVHYCKDWVRTVDLFINSPTADDSRLSIIVFLNLEAQVLKEWVLVC